VGIDDQIATIATGVEKKGLSSNVLSWGDAGLGAATCCHRRACGRRGQVWWTYASRDSAQLSDSRAYLQEPLELRVTPRSASQAVRRLRRRTGAMLLVGMGFPTIRPFSCPQSRGLDQQDARAGVAHHVRRLATPAPPSGHAPVASMLDCVKLLSAAMPLSAGAPARSSLGLSAGPS
jgi:hypothetical protein